MTNVQTFADFTGQNIFVGLDVHKKSWNISVFFGNEFYKTFTQPPSPEALWKYLHKEFPGGRYYCCYESGFCGFWIQRELKQMDIDCIVVHAADVPRANKHKVNKTDQVDSKSLGQALSGGSIQGIYIPDTIQQADRSLVRQRSRLLRDIHRCKNRIKSFLMFFGIEIPAEKETNWSKVLVQWLTLLELKDKSAQTTLNRMIEQLELLRGMMLKVNKDIRQLQKEVRYSSLIEVIRSTPGIGPLTAITLLTEVGDIRRFSSMTKFNSFVGLYPMEHSSGEYEHKGNITFRHNLYLRRLMVEAAWTAIRRDPVLMQCFNQWKQHMSAKRAIVKVARKLLSRVRYVWMNNQAYVTGLIK